MEPRVARAARGDPTRNPTAEQHADPTRDRRSVRLDYASTPPGELGDRLSAVRELGADTLVVEVSWLRHELAPGVFEWGEREPALDLPGLLARLPAFGLLALIHPGPWRTAGPRAVDVPEHVARLSSVRAWSAGDVHRERPSIASRRLIREVRRWHSEVLRVVAPAIGPRGPVRGFVASTPGPSPIRGELLDGSDDALRFERRYLELRDEAVPARPRAAAERVTGLRDLSGLLDRVEVGEAAARTWISRTRATFDAAPTPLTVSSVADWPLASGADARAALHESNAVDLEWPLGLECDYGELRLFGLRVDELGPTAGIACLPVDDDVLGPPPCMDPAMRLATLAMSGVRSFGFDAAPGPDSVVGVSRWLRNLRAIEHARLVRRSDLLLLDNRETARMREACSLGPPPPVDLGTPRERVALRVETRDLGLRDRPELDGDVGFRALADSLRLAGIKLAVADSGVPAERLARARAIALVGFERIGRSFAARLFEWVRAGGHLILGPRVPSADWRGGRLELGVGLRAKDRVPAARLGQLALQDVDLLEGGESVLECDAGVIAARASYGRGRIVHFGFRLPLHARAIDMQTLAGIGSALARAANVEPGYPTSDPVVETEFYQGEVRRFLFVSNPSARARRVTIALPEREALREVRGRAVHARAGEPFEVPARTVLLQEVVKL